MRGILYSMLKPLDVIELRTVVAGWEAGTIATVLESAPDRVLAEVSDEDGRTLDVVTRMPGCQLGRHASVGPARGGCSRAGRLGMFRALST